MGHTYTKYDWGGHPQKNKTISKQTITSGTLMNLKVSDNESLLLFSLIPIEGAVYIPIGQ